MFIMDTTVSRLKMFGYRVRKTDHAALAFAINKTEQGILNDCNIDEIPNGLEYVLVDRAVGEFLLIKRATAGDGLLSRIDLNMIASQIKEGDVTVSFGAGSDMSPSARFDALVQALRTTGRGQLIRYRRIAW